SPEEVVGMASENIKAKYKLYVIKQSFSNVIDNAFKDCGTITVRKVFAPDCVGACVLSDSMRQGGVALIDLGAGASSVSIFHGGVLKHYGAIPFGGTNISIDIANICGISERLAENIKLAYGGCIPDRLGSIGDKKLKITNHLDKSVREVSVKYLSEIITARQREIIDALLYEIQTSGYADKLKNGVVLTGGAAAMLNLCTFFKQVSGYNAKVGTTSQNLFSSEDGSFFTLGASFSSGLLRSYAGTETLGCQGKEEEKPEPQPQEQEEDINPGELFKVDTIEPPVKKRGGQKGQGNSLLSRLKKSISGEREDDEEEKGNTAKQEKAARKEAKKKVQEREESENKIFGEDEDV
ncbi:MAG: rod shape-determining protein, partial [Bacteroidales bacterium]|nr:rod shape-determining protein [Bacteroidales bacterium]